MTRWSVPPSQLPLQRTPIPHSRNVNERSSESHHHSRNPKAPLVFVELSILSSGALGRVREIQHLTLLQQVPVHRITSKRCLQRTRSKYGYCSHFGHGAQFPDQSDLRVEAGGSSEGGATKTDSRSPPGGEGGVI